MKNTKRRAPCISLASFRQVGSESAELHFTSSDFSTAFFLQHYQYSDSLSPLSIANYSDRLPCVSNSATGSLRDPFCEPQMQTGKANLPTRPFPHRSQPSNPAHNAPVRLTPAPSFQVLMWNQVCRLLYALYEGLRSREKGICSLYGGIDSVTRQPWRLCRQHFYKAAHVNPVT